MSPTRLDGGSGKNILGISYGTHDTSACIMQSGRVVAAVEEEKMNREKRTDKFPIEAINSCLDIAGITADQIDIIALPVDLLLYFRNTLEILKTENCAKVREKTAQIPMGVTRTEPSVEEKTDHILKNIREMLSLRSRTGIAYADKGHRPKVRYFSHHLSHAASAYYSSGFVDSAIVVIDGVGELDTISIYDARNGRLKKLLGRQYPHSIGKLYSAVCRYLGFFGPTKEGKVMALASYGSPVYYDEFSEMIAWPRKGLPRIDQSFFRFSLTPLWPSLVSEKFVKLLGEARTESERIEERHQNVAASLQKIYEETLIRIVNMAKSVTRLDNLCLAGGTMLNCKANAEVRKSRIFGNIYLHPTPHDAGLGLGAAYLAYHEKRRGDYVPTKLESVYLGPQYSGRQIVDAALARGLKCERIGNPEELASRLISQGTVTGWFTGRLEYGPRALGNRCILADPRDPGVRDRLNLSIKLREYFRPFAPAVLIEKAHEIFGCEKESPHMLDAFDVEPEWRRIIPAVLHVDSTARIQTVSKTNNLRFYNLISEFYELTGVPLILNTSLNVKGEPIVSSVENALDTFINSELTHLFVEEYLFAKE
jgi:carbamoyltransferase